MHAPFVFDDLDSIQRNTLVRFGSQYYRQLGVYFSPRSLLFLTFAFNNWLNGQNPLGYHVVNVLLHTLNALIVFTIARRIYRVVTPSLSSFPDERGYALLAAAFFLVHPLQTESVTYISSRSELLSTMAYLCGLFSFLLIPETKIGFLASLPMLFFLGVGLGFKETVITFPAGILLYDYLFVAKTNIAAVLGRWRFYITFLVLSIVGSTWILQDHFATIKNFGGIQAWYYFLTQLRVILRYVRLIVFPSGLNLDYDFPISRSLIEPGTFLSLLGILSLVCVGWIWRKNKPIYSFALFWFLLTLAPTSSIIPIPDVIFEHRLYLPLAGVCLSFPFAMEWLVRKATGSLEAKRVMTFSCLVLAALMAATILRNDVWSDEVRLFSDVVAKSPHKLRPYNDLVLAYMKAGQDGQAISVAKLGAENIPEYRVSFLDTIGNLYLRLGDPAASIEYFKKSNDEAIRLGVPGTFLATSFNNVGVAYMALAKTEPQDSESRGVAFRKAREAFQKSLEQKANDVGVMESIVNVSHALNEGPILEAELRKRLELKPNDFASLYMLASLLSLGERYKESIEYFQRVQQQEPSSEVLNFNYAFALSKVGDIDRAIEKYLDALQRDALFNEAHYNVALLYIQKTDYAKSVEHLMYILNQEPSNIRAHMKLAEIYAYQGKLSLAKQHLQQVLQANPRNEEALGLIEKIGRSE